MRKHILALLLAILAPGYVHAYDAASKIEATPGSLPLLLTVPHDGTETLGWMAARMKGVTVRDLGTAALAGRVADALEKRTGKRPYIVIAKFSRKYLDANRQESDAMESSDALPAYRAYHERVAAYVAELKAAFPDGALLLDVHGQDQDSDTVFRGTRAGLTTKALIGRFGPRAIQGGDSIIGSLAAKGYQVNPAVDAQSLREDRRFDGGHTVFTYGSHRPGGVDAIQLELGLNHRNSTRFAEDLADALVKHMQSFQNFSSGLR